MRKSPVTNNYRVLIGSLLPNKCLAKTAKTDIESSIITTPVLHSWTASHHVSPYLTPDTCLSSLPYLKRLKSICRFSTLAQPSASMSSQVLVSRCLRFAIATSVMKNWLSFRLTTSLQTSSLGHQKRLSTKQP